MVGSARPLSPAPWRSPDPAVTPTTPFVSAGAGVAPVIVHGTPGLSTSGTWVLSSVPFAPVNVSDTITSAGTVTMDCGVCGTAALACTNAMDDGLVLVLVLVFPASG